MSQQSDMALDIIRAALQHLPDHEFNEVIHTVAEERWRQRQVTVPAHYEQGIHEAAGG